jgi:hypothetical protein
LLTQAELENPTRPVPPPSGRRPGQPLPPARHTPHLRSLVWWAFVVAVGTYAYWWQGRQPATRVARDVPRPEREAFLAISFPRISATIPEAMPAAVFREQMTALKSAGFTAIGLGDVAAFFHKRAPLPAHPVLLLFSEAQRETMEIADAALAELDMHGVFFVNLPGVQESNVDLVSRHRLVQLVESGRWDSGLDSGSDQTAEGADPAPLPVDQYQRDRKLMERWLERPVLAIAEQRQRFDEDEKQRDAWKRALGSSGFALGFVLAPPRANYVDESALEIRSVRVAREWGGAELVSQLAAREPRRQAFVDDFKPPNPSPSWVVDHGEVAIDNDSLRLAAKDGQTSALVWLGGTERWRDASVNVALAAPPKGQFWITLRNRGSGPFLRFGVDGAGRAVVQKSTADGSTHEVAARGVGRGPIALTLRMIGSRADAAVNGQSMTERPAEIPTGMVEGAVTLAVWSAQGEASARIRHIETAPLSPALVLLAGSPDEASWSELRRRADQLSILSPRGGAGQAGAVADEGASQAVEIFARYHHLNIFPAIVADHRPTPTETRRLVDAATRAARGSAVDGVNLLIAPELAGTKEGLDLVSAVRSAVNKANKPTIVTVLGASRSIPRALDDLTNVFVLTDERASHVEIAEEPLRLVQPGA